MRIKLIANPVSGQKRLVKYLPQIVKTLDSGNSLDIEITREFKGPFFAAQKAAGENFDIVVACGGDGTAHEVVNGILSANSRMPIGFVPLGTSNAYALSLGLPKKPSEACKVILNGRPLKIDLGKMHNGGKPYHFLTMAGIGFDAHAIHMMKPFLRKVFDGITAHVISGLYTGLRFERRGLLLKIDGSTYDGYQVFVFNGKYYGASILFSKDSELSDGFLDVYLFTKGKYKSEVARYVLGIAGQYFSKFDDVAYFRTPALEVTSEHEVWAHADGELVGTLPQKVEVSPKSLEVIVP